MNDSIRDIRKDYTLSSLDEKDVSQNPVDQFTKWWNEAVVSEITEVNAMTLATATKDGKPSARIVLLKNYDERGFVFFTNYESHKGKELAGNTNAALVFFWKEIERQVRIEGIVEKTTAAESDDYYFSRPEGSRIGAWSSPQSQVIPNRKLLEDSVAEFSEKFKTDIERPPFWGGYRLMPELIEFWQGRSNRLHDRIQYTKPGNYWKIERLAP